MSESKRPKPDQYAGPFAIKEGKYNVVPLGEPRVEDGKIMQTFRLDTHLIECVIGREPTLEKGMLKAMWQHLDGALCELDKARHADDENAALAALTSLEQMAKQIRLHLSKPVGHE
jgi:hypothetical protein